MCGICGIFYFDQKKEVDHQELSVMIKSISHRGSDDEGIFAKGNFGFGNCRLSIIDIKGGHQPIFNEDQSLGIVFNGEIYNFLNLKNSLLKKGHKINTRSDTEVILHLYEDLGSKCLERLDGMFALAIFDFKKKELFLARDPMGKKPLYWASFGGKFVFASEPKAILAFPDFKRKVDQDSLTKYFFYGYVPSPNTIFEGIKRLSSGSFMLVKRSGIEEEKKFWEIDYSRKLEVLNEEEIKSKTKLLLKRAVEKRLVSDVPVGIFLSGGIDSSLVAALVPNKKIEAFTIGFEDKKMDESLDAKAVADYLGIKHNLRNFSNKEVLSTFPEALELMDEPNADPSILPTYLVSAFARTKVKVVLSGDGGDESFAGYPKYLGHFLLEKSLLGKMRRLPVCYAIASLVGSGKGKKFWQYASLPLYLRNQLWLNFLSVSKIEELTGTKLDLSDINKYHWTFNGKNPLDEAFFLDQKMTLADQNLVKVDRASMANSLEVRCPFLDKELVQFAAGLKFEDKIKGFKTKAILRVIAKDLLPKEIINLSKKGFGIPLKKWLDNELTDIKNHYLSIERIDKENLLNPQTVKQIIKDNNPDTIWKLLVFEVWADKWLKQGR